MGKLGRHALQASQLAQPTAGRAMQQGTHPGSSGCLQRRCRGSACWPWQWTSLRGPLRGCPGGRRVQLRENIGAAGKSWAVSMRNHLWRQPILPSLSWRLAICRSMLQHSHAVKMVGAAGSQPCASSVSLRHKHARSHQHRPAFVEQRYAGVHQHSSPPGLPIPLTRSWI